MTPLEQYDKKAKALDAERINLLWRKLKMDETMICQLQALLNDGVQLAWVYDEEFFEITDIEFVNGGAKGRFGNRICGGYVDLFNVSPECVVKFESLEKPLTDLSSGQCDENARIQHEIQMTEDKYYGDWYTKREKQIDIDEYGIDED